MAVKGMKNIVKLLILGEFDISYKFNENIRKVRGDFFVWIIIVGAKYGSIRKVWYGTIYSNAPIRTVPYRTGSESPYYNIKQRFNFYFIVRYDVICTVPYVQGRSYYSILYLSNNHPRHDQRHLAMMILIDFHQHLLLRKILGLIRIWYPKSLKVTNHHSRDNNGWWFVLHNHHKNQCPFHYHVFHPMVELSIPLVTTMTNLLFLHIPYHWQVLLVLLVMNIVGRCPRYFHLM